jgi:hypothetical protein
LAYLIRTVALPLAWDTDTKTSTRTWSEATSRVILPGEMVLIPGPTMSISSGAMTDLVDKALMGAILANVTSTTWARTLPTSSHLEVNLARLTDSAGIVCWEETIDGVYEIANRCSRLLLFRGGRVILCKATLEDTGVDHWNMLLVFQFFWDPCDVKW